MHRSDPSAYDAFARIYHQHWGLFAGKIYPIIDHLVLRDLPPGCAVLDLCCGTGQLASKLSEEGYSTTGVDGSERMIAIARGNAPEVEFFVGDARNISLDCSFSAVFSTFDSLNHLMSLDDLEEVFQRVHSLLEDGGYFEFDLNMEEAYLSRWGGTFAYVEDDHVCVVRTSKDEKEKTGRFDVTSFEFKGADWVRKDFSLLQRWYRKGDITGRLRKVGFGNLRTFDGNEPVAEGMPRYPGRMFFVARKPE